MSALTVFLVALSTYCADGNLGHWGDPANSPDTPATTLLEDSAQGSAEAAPKGYSPCPIENPSGLGLKSINAPDVYGTFSVEKFQGTAPDLTYTHESAAGFRSYLKRWWASNYIYQDGGVGAWAFHDIAGGDNYDLWSSNGVDYGIDAVLACFHSSHGTMLSNGTYQTCLGTDWYGRGWRARSDKMVLGANAGRFGDERLRYMFWDTCLSVRCTGGFSPMSTWGPRARGIRMIFGYDTVSVDSPNYGKYFWEEWNKGKSLSRAFLDASWRIDTDQRPCVVAFGSTSSEANTRLNDERLMAWGAVKSSWAAWRWYHKAAKADGKGAADLSMPARAEVRVAEVLGNSNAEVRNVAELVGVEVSSDRLIQERPFGLRVIEGTDKILILEPDGDVELELQQNGRAWATGEVPDDELIQRAGETIEKFQLDRGMEYSLGEVRCLSESSSSQKGATRGCRVVEKTVVFDQVLNGMRFIDPDTGHVEVSFDATTSEPVRVRSSVRRLAPSAQKKGGSPLPESTDELRAAALKSVAPPPVPGEDERAGASERLQVVAGSERVGYSIVDGKATPIYRVLIEDSSSPGSKLREVTLPLVPGE